MTSLCRDLSPEDSAEDEALRSERADNASNSRGAEPAPGRERRTRSTSRLSFRTPARAVAQSDDAGPTRSRALEHLIDVYARTGRMILERELTSAARQEAP